ncbi:MAG TPA: hypothetical protein VMT30_08000 [Candidatus Saccharimonadia bacterium]|nr:hypothetical protein [Candidatus Saccharimonadia bacterium]
MIPRSEMFHSGGYASLPAANPDGRPSIVPGAIWPVVCLTEGCVAPLTIEGLRRPRMYGVVWAGPPLAVQQFSSACGASYLYSSVQRQGQVGIGVMIFAGSIAVVESTKGVVGTVHFTLGDTGEVRLAPGLVPAIVQFPLHPKEPPYVLAAQMSEYAYTVLVPHYLQLSRPVPASA